MSRQSPSVCGRFRDRPDPGLEKTSCKCHHPAVAVTEPGGGFRRRFRRDPPADRHRLFEREVVAIIAAAMGVVIGFFCLQWSPTAPVPKVIGVIVVSFLGSLTFFIECIRFLEWAYAKSAGGGKLRNVKRDRTVSALLALGVAAVSTSGFLSVAKLAVDPRVLLPITPSAACGSSTPNQPHVVAPGMIAAAEPSTSLQLPSGDPEYLYVGSEAGGNPITGVKWHQDLQVRNSYNRNISISLGRSQSSQGQFDAGTTTNVAIGGFALQRYRVVGIFSSASSLPGPGSSGGGLRETGGASATLNFEVTEPREFVLLLVGGQGTGAIAERGTNLSTLFNFTYSECGSEVVASVAAFGGALTVGPYGADITSITSLNNSGSAIGAVAYVLRRT